MKSQLHPGVVIGVVAAVIGILVVIAVNVTAPRHPLAAGTPNPGGPLSHGNLSDSDAQRYQERMQQMVQRRAQEMQQRSPGR